MDELDLMAAESKATYEEIRDCVLEHLFPEFQLGGLYKADYLLVGMSSGGFEFIFVELKNPYGKITLKDGQSGAEFRNGISQLEDWKRWLPSNYSSFGEIIKIVHLICQKNFMFFGRDSGLSEIRK